VLERSLREGAQERLVAVVVLLDDLVLLEARDAEGLLQRRPGVHVDPAFVVLDSALALDLGIGFGP
jgi:hypothetical protein